MPPSKDNKPTLVLDLDHTLIFPSYEKPINSNTPTHEIVLNRDDSKLIMWIIERPYLKEFLKNMAYRYEIILFTGAIKLYAETVIKQIDPDNCIIHILTREHCSFFENSENGKLCIFKDLKYLGRDLNKTIIIDDKEYSYIMNYANGQYIPPYTGESNDMALLELSNYLIDCLKLDDFTNREFLTYKTS